MPREHPSVELQKLSASALIELFELDPAPDDPGSVKYYFHAGTNELSENLVWQGVTYVAMPIKVVGYETSMTSSMPRLKMTLANLDGIFTALIVDFDDLIYSKLTRHRTFARYLDAVNFPGGVNPDADPDVYLVDDVFYGMRKVTENKNVLEIEFATKFEVDGVKLPRRQVTANLCAWQLRDGSCGYSGVPKMTPIGAALAVTPTGMLTEYNEATAYTAGEFVWYGSPVLVYLCKLNASAGILPSNTTYWQRTGCVKTLAACKTHHGATAALPFGAFPGVAKLPVT